MAQVGQLDSLRFVMVLTKAVLRQLYRLWRLEVCLARSFSWGSARPCMRRFQMCPGGEGMATATRMTQLFTSSQSMPFNGRSVHIGWVASLSRCHACG